ncbi:MAG: hypothetical protein C4521_12045 [Actinobacteria bacterium]|nr:MAG: hypothetical protein C4521_12045 [Actinomycetota bacterium]
MKNMSIRSRIIAGVVLVNLVGGVVAAVHLHATFSRGLDVASTASIALTNRAWEQVSTYPAVSPDFATLAKAGKELVVRLKQSTGQDYGLLLAKSSGDPSTYATLRAKSGLPNDWATNPTYVNVAVTDPTLTDRMTLTTPPKEVAESGQTVGIENGACSATCHGSVTGTGDFWGVSWSKDSRSRAYAVLPIPDATGKSIGLIYSVADISTQANTDRASLMRVLGVILIGLAAATLIIGFLLDTLVFKRLARTTSTIREASLRLAGGNFSTEFEPDGTSDEIGTFEKFFADFLHLLSSVLRSLFEQREGQHVSPAAGAKAETEVSRGKS